MKRLHGIVFLLLSIGCVIFFSFQPVTAAERTRYVVIDLGGFGGPYHHASRINNHGQIVGISDDTEGERQPFIWENGVMHDLGRYEGYWTIVQDINDLGQVVGYYRIPLGVQDEYGVDLVEQVPFYYDQHQGMASLGIPALWESAETVGINNLGQIIVNAGPYNRAPRGMYLYDFVNGYQEMPTFGGVVHHVEAINDSGKIVGTSQFPHDEGGHHHAFLWDALNGLSDLTPDAWLSRAWDINNLDQIVGRISIATDIWQGIRWENGMTTELGVILPQKINDLSQILYGSDQVMLIDGVSVYDLLPDNTLWSIDNYSGLVDINNHGQIVGHGKLPGEGADEGHAVLLQPIPAIGDTVDFSGDGRPDLVTRTYVSGENTLWYMNGTTVASRNQAPRVTDPNWEVATAADFNSDGNPDLVWRNYDTRDSYIWFMNGPVVLGGASLPWVWTAFWRIVDARDFNGDGHPDILWWHYGNGSTFVWYMNGSTVTGGAALPSAPVEWTPVAADDFNGDGSPDILWRQSTTGENFLWFLDGTSVTGGASLPAAEPLWGVDGVADFNDDGMPDICWRNTQTCDTYVWYMDGPSPTGGELVQSICDPGTP